MHVHYSICKFLYLHQRNYIYSAIIISKTTYIHSDNIINIMQRLPHSQYVKQIQNTASLLFGSFNGIV